MDDLLGDDAEHVIDFFENELAQLHKSVRRTNVLVIGAETVGKSSIVEAVFGLDRHIAAASVAKKKARQKGRLLEREASFASEKGLSQAKASRSGDFSGFPGFPLRRSASANALAEKQAEKKHLKHVREHSVSPATPATSVPGACGQTFQHSWKHSEKFFHTFESDHLMLIDSRGLNADNGPEFVEATREFLNKRNAIKQPTDTDFRKSGSAGISLQRAVHVVWFIKDARERLQPFEEEVLRDVFDEIPLIVVLNKCDLATDDEISAVAQQIRGLELPSVAGIFRTHMVPRVPHSPPVFADMDAVIQRTLELLPEVEAEAFLVAQRSNFVAKDEKARKIISEFAEEAQHARSSKIFQALVAKMITRLSVLWNFRQHGHLYGAGIAKDITRKFTFRDRMFFMLHQTKKERENIFHAIAFGLLWNSCVRKLNKRAVKTMCSEMEHGAKMILHDTIRGSDSYALSVDNPLSPVVLLKGGHAQSDHGDGQESFTHTINESFSLLNLENCHSVVDRIREAGWEPIVSEMTTGADRDHLLAVNMKKTWSEANLVAMDARSCSPDASSSGSETHFPVPMPLSSEHLQDSVVSH